MAFNPKACILVVDDNELMRNIVCFMLSRLGYMTITARDGTEALDSMKNNDNIHLVLTDINMPQMDGWELALHIKEVKPDIPIVVLTGEAPDAILPKLLDNGIHQALLKPIKLEDLRVALSRNLRLEGMKLAS